MNTFSTHIKPGIENKNSERSSEETKMNRQNRTDGRTE